MRLPVQVKHELQQDQQKKYQRYMDLKQFLQQYRKPMLQSAFDLQSRLVNQVGHKQRAVCWNAWDARGREGGQGRGC